MFPVVERVLDWLGSHSTAVVIPCGVGLIVVGAGVDHGWGTRTAVYWTLAALVCIIPPAILTQRSGVLQSRRAQRAALRRLLRTCAQAFGYPERHIRVNLMYAVGQIRRVDPTTAFNMADDPDNDLELSIHAGVSGEAAHQRRPTFGDLRLTKQPGGPTWGITPAQSGRIRSSLKSILSAPVMNPHDPDGPVLATLQIDSDMELEATGFDDDRSQELAQAFADVVALLLESSKG